MGIHVALLPLAAYMAAASVSSVEGFQTSRSYSVMGPSSIHGMGSVRASYPASSLQTGSTPFAALAAPHLARQPSTPSSRTFARRSKKIILADECRNQLLEGIQQVADAVRVTLGPRGRNILLEKDYGPPLIVNDGVTIARNIELPNRAHNAGAKLVQEVASTSDEWAGDGTSSTTILTAEIAKKGVEYVNQGHNPIPLQRGIQKAARIMMDEVRNLAKPVNGFGDLLNIATVATSGNAAMGEVIARAFDKLGNHAAIVLENNPSQEDTLEFTEGYTFERGYSSPYFLLGEEADFIEWKNPHVMVCDYKIESAQAMLPILEHFVRTKEPLVIIAEDFSTDMLQTCIINSMRRLLKVVTIRAPSFGERRKDYLRDIAVATNAQLISKDLGLPLEEATPEHVGSAQGVVVRKDRTSILTRPEFQDQIQERVQRLQGEMESATSKFDKDKLGERVAALSGGIARIMIGASTETEQKEKKLRYEDAINAVRAAIETGYVPGGGVTYLALSTDQFRSKVLKMVEETAREEMKGIDESTGEEFQVVEEMESEIELQKAGATIVADSMESITKQIALNAGLDGDRVVNAILKANKPFGFGWNAKTNKFGDMISQGVIDPAKVCISAIEHSTSVAGLVLTTEGMMIEEEQERNKSSPDDGEL
ncbi:chaperonin CPN60, mitochondrial [Cyclospora cayetanensis]|uniref:Chaperonin CPN60, mitochondrial n=2 Tax=Cyclospora cayetanensis TaxID=88456 RepID=A0A6P5WC48_9EIME|nr:chaperonin CPN60, mitochondrial [Cyclospora cayetanensis]